MAEIDQNKIINGLKSFLLENKLYKNECEKFLKLKTFAKSDVVALKEFFTELLLNTSTTESLASCFPEEIVGLLEATMLRRDEQNFTIIKTQNLLLHTQYSIILSKLLTIHPDVLRFSLQYFSVNPSPFHYKSQENYCLPKKRLKPNKCSNITDLDVVQCCLTFLIHDRDHFSRIWKWSHFIELFGNSSDEKVKWFCYKCISIITHLSESNFRKICIQNNMEIDCMSIRNEINKHTNIFKSKTHSFYEDSEREIGSQLNKEIVAQISDIALPKGSEKQIKYNRQLILVKSTNRNLRSIALGISTGRVVCLTGCVGSGKTSIIEYLAYITGSKLFKVQLGDQTDSKMLLGSYRCSDIPSEFIWSPGVLTQAVMNGHWLLFEDIDAASSDVLSVLSGLIESNKLIVPGYREEIHVATGFQLFLTQRLVTTSTGHHKRKLNLSHLIDKNIIHVYIETLTQFELVEIVKALFPSLATIAERMVNVYLIFSSGNHQFESNTSFSEKCEKLKHVHTSGRLISTRDFMKWCDRSTKDFDVSSQKSALKIFQDAIDIFCCSFAQKEIRYKLALEIASELGIVGTYGDFYINSYKPNIEIGSTSITIGDVTLSRRETELGLAFKNEMVYTFTKPSSCLLERVAKCISMSEPVLLVGETGTGKTSSVQFLAEKLGFKLIVINMNQQSDNSDLLGGYKPVDMKFIVTPIRREFEDVFRNFYKQEKNEKFLGYISMIYNQCDWKSLVKMMKQCQYTALTIISSKNKIGSYQYNQWQNIGTKILKLETLLKSKSLLAFSFIEGSLVNAVKNGYWVLLDEINLASAETLECLSGLLEGTKGSISLLERGDHEPIKRHENFTLFACMNPATDVGKKDLPIGLRNRFTEYYVEELTEHNDLLILVEHYLKSLSPSLTLIQNVVKFYLNARKEAASKLFDGTGQQPYFTLRTLCRALIMAARCGCGSLQRTMFEALCVSFLTQLDTKSHARVSEMIVQAVLGKDAKSILSQPLPEPDVPCVQFEGYWVPRGELEPFSSEKYILTESVHKNLRDLARIVSIGRLPVLLQGDTSVGKTSLITYLAKASGNKCVRINNHEHTDLQEYIGSYVANERGMLIFCEGALVQAMRFGHWIILDELNLAPSDVLEALNRVLDDNRELFIPETQTVVKAHPNFMIFATQNPPGIYGGRKVLSRAFRNRFIELHFNEIPSNELQTILSQRCHIPPTYSKKMVAVMTELQLKRRGSAACSGKHGFMTLRDLFRWGERYRLATNIENENNYDWEQHLADEGYLVLASRVREHNEKLVIQEAIKKHMKRLPEEDRLFTLTTNTSLVTKHILIELQNLVSEQFPHIVWTKNLRRLMVLLRKTFQYKEPALLVGDTGCGKTTVCQLLASHLQQEMKIVNCHMHSEASDFLGGLRPVRNKNDNDGLFEWVDGPLIHAMNNGEFFLADEISLADDSVLERLNSLLEPERKLLVAEKNVIDGESCEIIADEKFHFCATMNPSGDYGKKELSPALRNRFTEIWCDSENSREDMLNIINHNLNINEAKKTFEIGKCILDFVDWFKIQSSGIRLQISIRDILTWLNFINNCTVRGLTLVECFVQGAFLIFLERLGSEGSIGSNLQKESELHITEILQNYIQEKSLINSVMQMTKSLSIEFTDKHFGINPFYCKLGPCINDYSKINSNNDFVFTSPTIGMNTFRLLRGMQLSKPILLEGSPGVGKTSIVSALSKVSGNKLVRINLSEHTDISDLFGADLPVEGEKSGSFAWRDGPFLQALRNGYWVLLDELNLAPQPVLEGLNACFDHRGQIFIPELNRTFNVKPNTRFFACQNPLSQGGSRRGLPQSFLNRFTQVHFAQMHASDLEFIASSQYSQIPKYLISKMVKFVTELATNVTDLRKFGHKGSPWEFNLRDVQRWCECLIHYKQTYNQEINPNRFVDLIFIDRMRTQQDRILVKQLYDNIFADDSDYFDYNKSDINLLITCKNVYIGDCVLERSDKATNLNSDNLLVLRNQLPLLRNLGHCINMNWMTILVGDSCTGKTSVISLLAKLCNRDLKVISVNSAMDTTEILGGFEQANFTRHFQDLMTKTHNLLLDVIHQMIDNTSWLSITQKLLSMWENLRNTIDEPMQKRVTSITDDIDVFCSGINILFNILAALKDLKFSEYDNIITQLNSKLIELKKDLEKDNSSTVGGKFEWVDSMLVKCLNEGSWLVLDNVNLCSSAVLDRLNGLLEPSGELILSERGVDSKGELVIVKPHPLFRLFLVMDPRHGEISRAMRNRGIELCILDKLDLKPGSQDILDVKSLMTNIGVCNHSIQDTLIKIHNAVCNMLPEYEQPNSHYLLDASFLTAQQIKRGTPLNIALMTSCCDLYIKSKSNYLNSLILNNLSNSIQDIIENYSSASYKFDNTLDINNFTLSSQRLSENCVLSLVLQQSELFFSLLRCSMDNFNKTELINFLYRIFPASCDLNNIDMNIIMYFLLIEIYQMSSLDDVNSRFFYMETNLKKYSSINADSTTFYRSINRAFCDIIKESNILNQADMVLPWDGRNGINFSCTKLNVSSSNKILLHLYYTVLTNIEHSKQNTLTKSGMTNLKSKTITVYEYSNAVLHNQLTDTINLPLVKFYVVLLKYFDSFVNTLLSDVNFNLSTQKMIDLYCAVQWRFRFQRIGSSVIINKQNKSVSFIESVIIELTVHYQWFLKWCLKPFETIKYVNKSESYTHLEQLRVVLSLVNSSVNKDCTPLQSLRKQFNKLYKMLPYSSFNEADLLIKLDELNKKLSLWWHMDQSHITTMNSRIKALCQEDGYKMHDLLVEAYFEVKNKNYELVSNIVHKIEKFCIDTIKVEDQLLPKHHFKKQLWTLQEFYIFYAINYMLSYFLEKSKSIFEQTNPINENLVMKSCFNYIIDMLSTKKQIPPKFIHHLKNVNDTGTSSNLINAINSINEYEMNFLMTVSSIYVENPGEDMINMAKHSPLLIAIVNDIIYPKNKQLDSLDTVLERKQHLTTINKLLYNNMVLVNYVNVLEENAQYIINSYKLLILELATCLKLSAVPFKIAEVVNLCNRKLDLLFVGHNDVILKQKNNFKQAINKSLIVMKSLEELVKIKLKNYEWKIEMIYQVGLLNIFIGLLKITLFCSLGPMDSIQKHGLKLQYIKEELLSAENFILSGKLNEYIKNGSLDVKHDYHKKLYELWNNLKLREQKLSEFQAVRPVLNYSSLSKDCEHFIKTITSSEFVFDLLRKIEKCKILLYDGCFVNKNDTSEKGLDIAKQLLSEISSWKYSQIRFKNHINTNFMSYPDLIKPISYAVSHLVTGVQGLEETLMKLIFEMKSTIRDKDEILTNIIKFPFGNIGSKCFVNDLISGKTSKLLKNYSKNTIGYNRDNYIIMLNSLKEIKNYCIASNSLSPKFMEYINIILKNLVCQWQKQEQEKEQKKIDEDNLYVTKVKCQEEDEEQQTCKEIQEFFPSFLSLDFYDFKSDNLNNVAEKSKEANMNMDLITFDDMTLISSIHMDLMFAFTKTDWLCPKKHELDINYVDSLLERYEIFSRIIGESINGCNSDMDIKLLASLNTITSVMLDKLNNKDSSYKSIHSNQYDFYSDSNIARARGAHQILYAILDVVKKQLEDWPEHPILNDIATITNRVLNFSVNSPLSRFLTGIELLRDKVEEWNKNAHRENNLKSHALELAQLIIDWRKLELNSWRDCLNIAQHRQEAIAYKYWFFIYALIDQYFSESQLLEEINKALKQFIELSSISEYKIRLQILKAFHCHITYFPTSNKRDELLCLLWNLHQYYSQFISIVETQLKKFKTPIEKKMREFVKITSWDKNLSYWAVKDSVDKTHRTLHKHIKEYQEILRKPVTKCLFDNLMLSNENNVGAWDRPHRQSNQYQYMTETFNYIANIKLKRFIVSEVTENKMTHVFNKARDISKECILLCNYPSKLQTIDVMLTEIIDTSDHYRNLEINTTLPKNKQISQAKSILQQKRKALSDLFKYLQQIGLSYRCGLLEINIQGNDLLNFKIKPMDIEVLVGCLSSRKCDGILLAVWDGCDKYYFRSIARYVGLMNVMKSPAQDLGIQNIDRCKGFAADTILLVQSQKELLTTTSHSLVILRSQIDFISSLEETEFTVKQSFLETHLTALEDTLVHIISTMKQFKITLNSIPSDKLDQSITSDVISFDNICFNDSSILLCKEDILWCNTIDIVNNIISNTEKTLNLLIKHKCTMPLILHDVKKFKSVCFKRSTLYQVIVNGYIHVRSICKELEAIFRKFENDVYMHPMCLCVHDLHNSISEALLSYDSDSKCNEDKVTLAEDLKLVFTSNTDKLINTLQISLQSIYKKYLKRNESHTSSETKKNQQENVSDAVADEKCIKLSDIETNHLKQMHCDLVEDINLLNVKKIILLVEDLLQNAVTFVESGIFDTTLKSLLLQCNPMLEQLALLAQYFLTQQVATHRISCKMLSILLNIFSELGLKGFCTPPEFSDEIDQDDGKENKSGMGLADGEGERDVSERIENEDQLEDAHKEGMEQEPREDKDCEEEEKGIEMSDDFDGKLQDLKQNPDDESNGSDEDEGDDADKQMGDTEDGAEQLDQQIWGEDEDDNSKEESKEQGEGGEGQDTGEQEMGVQENEDHTNTSNRDPKANNDGEEEADSKQQKKEIDDMQEPDVNDDQINPYHGDLKPPPETEALDLPEDMQLDEGDVKEENAEESNPFDVDTMKEDIKPPDEEMNDEKSTEKQEEDTNQKTEQDSSDDEGDCELDKNTEEKDEEDQMKDDDDTTTKGSEMKYDAEDTPEPMEDNKNDEQNSEDQKTDTAASNYQPSEKIEVEPMETDEQCSIDQAASSMKPQELPNDNQKPFDNPDQGKDSGGQSQEENVDSGSKQNNETNITRTSKNTEQQEVAQKNLKNQASQANEERSLGDNKDSFEKHLKTVDINDKENENDSINDESMQKADMYKHIKDAMESDKQQVMDTATSQQAQSNLVDLEENDKNEEITEDDDVLMDVDSEIAQDLTQEELQAQKLDSNDKIKKEQNQRKKVDNMNQEIDTEQIEIEGEKILTYNVERVAENTFCTSMDIKEDYHSETNLDISQIEEIERRLQENLLASYEHQPMGSTEWEKLWWRTGSQARELCEQLRLILEPTLSARLKGDYRTGRRINMRKIVPYVASEFRKDKIWLRRTMPSKREYRIIIAIDDSSSMSGNQSTEMACESVALVSQALTLLEAGDLSVLSFGEVPKIIHPFREQLTSQTGSRIINQLTFQQKKSHFAKMLDFAGIMFEENSGQAADLLIIVSDGCISSENQETVRQAVRRLRQAKIFIIFLIVDNVKNNCSLVDTRIPLFNEKQQLIGMQWAMDVFPFPFYLFLRDLSSLPSVLSDALRQWFDLTTKSVM